MTKLIEFDGDAIRLTPDGEKLANELNAGKITVDDYFDKTVQNMVDTGLIEKIGEDHYQLTEKGTAIYREVERKKQERDRS